MGEEEKKQEEPSKPAGEAPEEEKKKEDVPDGKNPAGGDCEKKVEAEEPPPPQEILIRVHMHCEGCARKVRRCLKGFEGVEEVKTDCKASLVTVKGEKADPVKVLERVQRKSNRRAELLSPIPKPPPPPPPPEPEPKELPKVEVKEEAPTLTVVLGVYMHCEACALEIKKRIMRMKGVGSVDPDLKNSRVMVKGEFESEKLVDYIHRRIGKQATVINMEPEKKEEEPPKEEKKPEEPEKDGDAPPEKKEPEPQPQPTPEQEDPKLLLKRNELYYYYPQNFHIYPQRTVEEELKYGYGYLPPPPPPQMFSDENPNACSVM